KPYEAITGGHPLTGSASVRKPAGTQKCPATTRADCRGGSGGWGGISAALRTELVPALSPSTGITRGLGLWGDLVPTLLSSAASSEHRSARRGTRKGSGAPRQQRKAVNGGRRNQ